MESRPEHADADHHAPKDSCGYVNGQTPAAESARIEQNLLDGYDR
jgi:hypothetical protein